MNPNQEYHAILVSAWLNGPSRKYNYYFQRLKSKVSRAWYIHREHLSKPSDSHKRTLRVLWLSNIIPQYEVIYLGPATADCEPLFWRQSKATIITMDEGAANLTERGYRQVMRSFTEGMLTKLLRKILKMPRMSDLRTRSIKHVTIYPWDNASPNPEYLSLFDGGIHSDLGATQHKKTITLMLGQPIYDLDETIADDNERPRRNKLVTEAIVKQFRVEYYLPHPREHYQVEGIEYLDTPQVFEDYIMAQIKANPDTLYRIYMFCSTCAFNLANVRNIQFIGIRPSDCPTYLNESYDLLSQLGFNVQSFEVKK